jgi:TRAP-type C4-dicarboxylate transport system substrate-binding protein
MSKKRKKTVCLMVSAITMLFLLLTVTGMVSTVAAGEYSKTLKFASPLPEVAFASKMHQWWAQELEKRTNGRVKVKFFWMESLVKWKDMLHGVSSGLADVGLPIGTYHPTELPLYMVLDMPYNAVDYWAGTKACADTATKEPNMVAELKKNNLKHVGAYCSGTFHLGTRMTWKKLSELKGTTFRSYGGAHIMYCENLGINPIPMSYSAIYEALDRGTVVGNQTCVLQLSDALKHYEVMKQATDTKSGYVVAGASVAMNYKVFKKMPRDIQNILDQLNYDLGNHWAKALYEVEAPIRSKWREKGLIMNELSPEELKISQEAGRKAQEEFLSKLESQGHSQARTVWNHFRSKVVEYEKEVAEKGYPWERK